MKSNFILKNIILAIKGAIVGVGAMLPGVSGGVLCVAFGIYEPMMALLTHPVKAFKKYYGMFIPFLIGWALGFIFLAKGVEVLFSFSPEIALMLFFGLIMGTVPELLHEAKKSECKVGFTPFAITLSFAYLLFHILENSALATVSPSVFTYVLSGIIWGLSLIIPGLSSSSLLIMLGLYEPLTAGIAALDFSVILPFLAGIGTTALLLARVVTMLFEKHTSLLLQVISGFVIASSLKILPESFSSLVTLIISLICCIAGFTVARFMDIAKQKNASDS